MQIFFSVCAVVGIVYLWDIAGKLRDIYFVLREIRDRSKAV